METLDFTLRRLSDFFVCCCGPNDFRTLTGTINRGSLEKCGFVGPSAVTHQSRWMSDYHCSFRDFEKEMRFTVLYIKENVEYLRSRMIVLNPLKNNRGLSKLCKDLRFRDIRYPDRVFFHEQTMQRM